MTDLFSEIDNALSEIDEICLQQRKDDRMKMCGSAVIIKEMESGGRKVTYWYCKDSRCDQCNERKGDLYKQRIINSVNDMKNIQFIQLPANLSSKFCKKIGKENYLKIPNGKIDDIFYSQDSNNEKEYLSIEDINEYDWSSRVKKNSNRIISGSLGKISNNDKDIKYGDFEVDCMDVVAYPKQDAIKSIIETATSVIAWKTPDSVEENQEYRTVFNAKLIERLIINKCKILSIVNYKMKLLSLLVDFIDIKKLL